jgi:hypothetical protein
MGDRANVYVSGWDNTGVYLYTHWSGYKLPETVQAALVRGEDRWNDGQYLARIIFCEMVKGDEMNTTGYGISATVGAGGNRIIVLDPDSGTIGFAMEDGDERSENVKNKMTFAEYVALESPDWPER